MKEKYRLLMFILTLLLGVSLAYFPAFSRVRVDILKNVYVLPAAELVTTKTYPDIIEMENKYIKVSLLPNRGRLIFDYLFKPTGHTQIYTTARPVPTMTPIGYIVEFGGYYLSIPWNPRARQPYDLEYKIIEETAKKAKIYIWGKDPLRRLLLESWVSIEEGSSIVEIKVRITNKSRKKWKISLSDYLVVAPGGKLSNNSFFLLPASKVIIGKSEKEWMGKEGSMVNWPQAWMKWHQFEKFGSFSVDKDMMRFPFVGISNLDTGDTFLKLWEPPGFFDRLNIWSWGKEYKKIKGGVPTVNFENKKEKFTLDPGAQITFNVYFYGLRGIQKLEIVNKDFAGWVDTDKKSYNKVQGTRITVSSQIGTSKENKAISVVYFLCKEGEGIGKGVWGWDIGTFSPERLYETHFKIDIDTLKKGKYFLKARILDSKSGVIFEVDSPIFVVK